MSERTTVQIPLEITPEMRDELDEIARLSGIRTRMGVIRLACRQYADRFWAEEAARTTAQQAARAAATAEAA